MSEKSSFERLTVVQLREACDRRGLEQTGLKRELINRLKSHDEEQQKEDKMETDDATEKTDAKVEPAADEPKADESEEKPVENGKVEEEEAKEVKKAVVTKPTKKKGTGDEELLSDGRPKNLGKQKFLYGYMKMLSMKSVVIYPFKPEIFQSDVLRTYFEKAESYTIKNTKFCKISSMIMEFKDVDEGDTAWAAIHRDMADDEITVEHPDFHMDSTFWNHRVDTSMEWLLNVSVTKEMECRDQFAKRVLLFENVPESTHAELVEEFPEARNLVIFGHDSESPGMVGVELFSEKKAEEFMEKYKDHEYKEVKLSLEFYNVRFNRFDKVLRRYRKENPEKEFESLTDEERLVKVKDYLALNEAKKDLNNTYDYNGTQKIEKCQQLSETQVPIARHLFADAKRRLESAMEVPEPQNEQTPMVRNMVEGRLNQRKERAAEGNKIAVEREKKERARLLQSMKSEVKDKEKKGKRPATGASTLSGYPPHKKFQQSRGGGGGMGWGRGGSSQSGGQWGSRGGMSRGGFNRGMGGGMVMGLMDRGMGSMDRGMGSMDRGMGSMDRGMGPMDRGMGPMDRGMGPMDRGMDSMELGHGMGSMDRGMGRMDRMMSPMDRGMSGFGSMDRGDFNRGMGDSGDDMQGGGISSVSKTVQALTDKVRELEMLTNRGGGGGNFGMGGGNYDDFGSMQRSGARNFGHRGHSARGRRW